MRNILQIKVGLRIKGPTRRPRRPAKSGSPTKSAWTATYLASIEVGQRNVTLQKPREIANGFDMTLSEFFEGIPRVDPNT